MPLAASRVWPAVSFHTSKWYARRPAGGDGGKHRNQAPALLQRQAAGDGERLETENGAEDNEGEDCGEQNVFGDGSDPEWPGLSHGIIGFWGSGHDR